MKRKPKGPPNLPEIGDLCQLRGAKAVWSDGLQQWMLPPQGVCASVAVGSLWTHVWWQERPPSRETPTICHLYELERLEFNL